MNINCAINLTGGEFTYNGVKDFDAVMLVNLRDQLINFCFQVLMGLRLILVNLLASLRMASSLLV